MAISFLVVFPLPALHAASAPIGSDPVGGGGAGGNAASSPGSATPWVGSVDDTNTGTGNKLISVPIVSWMQRGGLSVDLTLNHNSQSAVSGELGPKWTMSYDDTLSVDSTSGNVTVHWGDGRVYTFSKNADGTYTPPPGIHDTLILTRGLKSSQNAAPIGYALTTKDQTRYSFSTSAVANVWYLGSIGDENGNYISIAYKSGTNLVQTVTDATGRSLSFAYDGNNHLTAAYDPKGRVWGFAYTGGELWYIAEPSVSFSYNYRAFAYNAANDIIQTQDRNNNQRYLSYNSDNSLAWEKDSLGNQTTFSYGTPVVYGVPNGGATTITDANGNNTIHYYVNGRLDHVVDATRSVENYGYDSSNNVTSRRDRNYQYWYSTYDGMGNVLTATDPLNHTTTYTYNTHNKPLTITAPSGRSAAGIYDASDNLTQVQQKDAGGNVLATTNYTIGSFGLVSDKYDPNNHHTAYTYDANGYLNSITTPLGSKTQWAYDALGFMTSRTDALGRTTTYTPDAWERLVTLTYPDNTTRTYGYDPNDNLTSFAASGGIAIARTYDADNRQIEETEGGTRTLTNTYDAAGQKGLLSTTKDFLGTVHSFTYTVRNELAQAGLPGQTASYTYDANGNQTLVVNPNGTQNKQVYDAANRVTGVTDLNASGGVLFSAGYTYNADNQKVSGSENNGAVLSWGYDALGRLTSEVRSGGIGSENISYGYDPAGNRTSQSGSYLNGTFSYNADDELTAFTYSGTSYASATFGYDANGERTAESTYLSPGNAGYGTTFGYDFEGNLTQIIASGSPTATFVYDGLDRQLGWQTSNGSRLDYQLDGNMPLTETNQTTSQVNLYGNGLVMSGGETLLPDGLGATRGTTNSSQSIVWSGTSQAFGVPLASSGSTVNHYQWGAGSGYRTDGFGPTGAASLMKVGARYYDPEFGCFLTRDTVLTEKPYAYCDGDPINFSDPSGHKKKNFWDWLKSIASAFGGLGKYIGGGFTALGAGLTGIQLGGSWEQMQINNQALANEREMLNSYQQNHPDADMTQQWSLYQYMQTGTLKSDGNFAADAANQYYHGVSGVR